MSAKLISIDNASAEYITNLNYRLIDFYSKVQDYSAFNAPSSQEHCWIHVANKIKELSLSGADVNVLEVGAGKSGFGHYLEGLQLRDKCIWTAQDVTTQNEQWLREYADKVILGELDETHVANYDIIFSTYVLEHVVNPKKHLEKLFSLVNSKSGWLYIFAPRYDVPVYLPPSTRHLSVFVRLCFAVYSLFKRVETCLTSKPSFLIQTDLAAFHRPFFTDADAVHWVSVYDLKAYARNKNADFKKLRLGNPKKYSKDWIVKRILSVAVEIHFKK